LVFERRRKSNEEIAAERDDQKGDERGKGASMIGICQGKSEISRASGIEAVFGRRYWRLAAGRAI